MCDGASQLVDAILTYADQAKLKQHAAAWTYKMGPIPDLRGKTCLTRKNLIDMTQWKLGGRKLPAARLVGENGEEAVRIISQAAFDLAAHVVPGPKLAVAVLKALEGVDVAVASTVLTAWDPDNYGIIDRRGLKALFNAPYDKS